MTPINLILCASALFLGLLMIGLGLPLAKERVKPNILYGFRLKRAFESEEAWYAINRVGGSAMVRWGIAVCVVALSILALPLDGNDALIVVAAIAPALFVVPPCWIGWRYAKGLPAAPRSGEPTAG